MLVVENILYQNSALLLWTYNSHFKRVLFKPLHNLLNSFMQIHQLSVIIFQNYDGIISIDLKPQFIGKLLSFYNSLEELFDCFGLLVVDLFGLELVFISVEIYRHLDNTYLFTFRIIVTDL